MIELKSATKAYGAGNAVGPLDLAIAEGQFVALLGGSGSGKTTTLKMINDLAPATAGQVTVGGQPLDAEPGWKLRRRIGYVFQEIGLFPHLTVAENIAVGPKLAGWDAARIAARTDELLDLVSLPRAVAARLPAALSGGQRQRVGVARALAAQPAIMLMDEPFGALDPVTRDDLGREYRALHERLGLTTVMVTHDVMEALVLADRIVVLDAGRIVADGTPGALMSGDQPPAVRALMQTPRRQAERIASLAAAPAPGTPGEGGHG
ncbi:ATP-binding cassette domain-containing protein [Caulobacter sp. KR2-114]|uniref:ATP-binding cassette domain-containing protein n=1 Tax=Caulobacter sp. KR2-114 TaxID=3400912 RepID=UPI003C0EC4ED